MTVEEIVPPELPTQPNNYPVILLAGAAAALAGAAVWAAISIVTNMQLGIIAILIGFMVGLAIQKVRRQKDPMLGWIGAGLALLGCVIGNALSLTFFVAKKYDVPFDQALMRMGIDGIMRLMVAGFEPMDLLFYAIAIYEGFKFSNR